jgi:hypothetical protein
MAALFVFYTSLPEKVQRITNDLRSFFMALAHLAWHSQLPWLRSTVMALSRTMARSLTMALSCRLAS